MTYLIDTDIIIYSLKNNENVLSALKKSVYIPKVISVISYGELIFGAAKSQNIEKNMAIVHHTAEIFPIIEISRSIIETFGRLKAGLQKEGNIIPDMDLLIGSTALAMNYCLVTNNVRHFRQIPGLVIENWDQE